MKSLTQYITEQLIIETPEEQPIKISEGLFSWFFSWVKGLFKKKDRDKKFQDFSTAFNKVNMPKKELKTRRTLFIKDKKLIRETFTKFTNEYDLLTFCEKQDPYTSEILHELLLEQRYHVLVARNMNREILLSSISEAEGGKFLVANGQNKCFKSFLVCHYVPGVLDERKRYSFKHDTTPHTYEFVVSDLQEIKFNDPEAAKEILHGIKILSLQLYGNIQQAVEKIAKAK